MPSNIDTGFHIGPGRVSYRPKEGKVHKKRSEQILLLSSISLPVAKAGEGFPKIAGSFLQFIITIIR